MHNTPSAVSAGTRWCPRYILPVLLFVISCIAAQAQPASLRILSPNGGENLIVGDTALIRWTATGLTGKIKVEYSADSGAVWHVIDSVTAVAGLDTLPWVVPFDTTHRALVRLSNGNRTSRSARVFNILLTPPPTVRMIYPNGNEIFAYDSTIQIRWNTSNVTGDVELHYSVDSGATWSYVITVPAAAGNDSIPWIVPHDSTTKAFFRIRTVDSSLKDASNRAFAILPELPSTLRVIYPNGNEVFGFDSTVKIRWNATNVTGNLDVHYSVDSGATWKTIATVPAHSGNDSLTWSVPHDSTTKAFVRVRTADSSLKDASNRTFTIRTSVKPTITLQYPNGGEVFNADSSVHLLWMGQDLSGQVVAEYSVDSGATWKAAGVRAARAGLDSLTWRVPNDPSTRALMRVTAAGVRDTSNNTFIINGRAPADTSISLLYPNGGERLRQDSVIRIRWTGSNLAGGVRVYWSNNNGAAWAMIDSVPARAGVDSITWSVPHFITDAARVRVDAPQSGVSDTSSAAFSIVETVPAGVRTGEADAGAALIGCFPNPATATTVIRWRQATAGAADIRVFDARGSLVMARNIGIAEAGEHAYTLGTATLASGAYRIELRAGTAWLRGSVAVVR